MHGMCGFGKRGRGVVGFGFCVYGVAGMAMGGWARRMGSRC